MRLSVLALTGACLAVPGALAAQAHAHGDHPHSHRGAGPHFIDAFFTENAYIERKLRPDVFFAAGDAADVWTAQLEIEWAVHRRASLIVHAPLHRLEPAGAATATGIGDVRVGAKLAVLNDRRRFILALGADAELPTGDADRGLGEEHAAAAPFLLAWLPFGPQRRWLLQAGVHADLPLEGREAAHWELGTAVSWTSPVGLTPIVELLAEGSGEGGPWRWAVAPEFRWEFAPAWEVGAALRLHAGGEREEDYRVAVGVIRHFPLPR